MTNRLTERIAPWVEAAVEASSAGDPITWEMTLHQIPSGGFGIALVLMMPGPILGSVIHSVAIINSPLSYTEKEAGEMVRNQIGNIRAERSRQLAPGNGQGNGQGQISDLRDLPQAHPHQH